MTQHMSASTSSIILCSW